MNTSRFNSSEILFLHDEQGVARRASSEDVLKAAREIMSRKVRHGVSLTSSKLMRDFLSIKLGNLEHEMFSVLLLDKRHRLIEYVELFRGTIDGASVHPREVVRLALAKNAAALAFAHLWNAHDGSGAYQLRLGCLRVVCTNGLIVSMGAFSSIRVVHRGNIVDEVVTSALQISGRFGLLASQVERMERRQLHKDEQIQFAERALSIRFPDPAQSGFVPAQLLTCRRVQDMGSDLWTCLK